MQDRVFTAGAIDCDIHPNVPSLKALLPYLEDHWREIVVARGMDELNSISYPANSPLTARTDWRSDQGRPAASLAQVQRDYLDVFDVSIAICNPLYGVQLLFAEDMAAAFARAVNNWMAAEWLDKDAAAARQHRRAAAEHRNGGRRDRALRQGPALRAGAAAGQRRPSARQAAILAESTPPPRATACRSASTPAATTTTRPPQSAGRATIPRTTSPRRRPSSRSSPA